MDAVVCGNFTKKVNTLIFKCTCHFSQIGLKSSTISNNLYIQRVSDGFELRMGKRFIRYFAKDSKDKLDLLFLELVRNIEDEIGFITHFIFLNNNPGCMACNLAVKDGYDYMEHHLDSMLRIEIVDESGNPLKDIKLLSNDKSFVVSNIILSELKKRDFSIESLVDVLNNNSRVAYDFKAVSDNFNYFRLQAYKKETSGYVVEGSDVYNLKIKL